MSFLIFIILVLMVCKYCYANFNDEKVKENVRLYNQASPLLCGNITSDDKITDRKSKVIKRRST